MGDPNNRLGADRITSNTQGGRAPWEEMLGKYPATPAARSIQAASAVQGMAGSWAGSWTLQPTGIMGETIAESPAPIQVIPNLLGRMGLPEINFVPYSANTNRIGNKGAALVGCPISFSVVGPTIKNRRTIWQWRVDNAKAVPTDPDVLTLDTVEAINVSGPVLPGPFDPLTRGISELYGINFATWETDFPGGLYVIVSMTGAEGALGGTFAGPGGVGDGFVTTAGTREALTPLESFSHYEIFRIADMDPVSLTLTSGKYLSDYFTIPAQPTTAIIRSITIVTPIASRCVALPGSRSKTFAILPPARAAVSDQQYPFDDWSGGSFIEELTSWSNTTPGLYNQGPEIPVPKPTTFLSGKLDGGGGVAPTLSINSAGTMTLWVEDSTNDYQDKVFCIRGLTVKGAAALAADPVTGFQANLESLLGYYEVLELLATAGSWRGYLLYRIDEADPVTGRSLFGCDRMFELQQPTVAGDEITLEVSVHEPISSIWMSAAFDYDAVDSARLKNLLDPRWVERSNKAVDGWPGTFPNRAEKAIFDTGGEALTGANPGNLYDLGFKVVLYPAEVDANDHISPAWERPVAANDLILGDSGTGEESFVEVDYANGLIRLSEAATNSASALQMGAGVSTHAENPRGEFVLFACCVPYTLEQGQTGTGNRVTGSYGSSNSVTTPGEMDHADVYGARSMASLMNGAVISSYYDTGEDKAIVLEGHVASTLPQAGFVEILQGATPFGTPDFADEDVRAATWGYFGTRERTVGPLPYTDLLNPFGGGLYGVSVFTSSEHKAILRRHTSPAWGQTGRMLTDYQYDTTYGQAARGGTLRFEGAEVTHNIDGSITVRMRNTAGTDNTDNFADLFSSWVLEGGVPTHTTAGLNQRASYTEMVVLVRGERFTIPAGYVSFATPVTPYYRYLYVDTSGVTPTMAISASIPLTPGDYSREHILISKCYDLGAGPLVLDLRYPLEDVDQRADIYVGNVENMEAGTPYFTTLAAAVAYANEIQTPDAGNAGRHVHIRVVGYTEEASADLPIMIKSDGIVITGSPRVESTDKVEIRWDEAQQSLIDLNGHDDLVFRGLSFRCTVLNTDPNLSPATMDRAVFTNTGGLCYRVTIENCRSMGFVQALVGTQETGSRFSTCTIRNNICQNLLDAGIHVESDSLPMFNSIIEDNYFEHDGAEVGGMAASGVLYLHQNAVVSATPTLNRISGNIGAAFVGYGLYAAPSYSDTIQGNALEDIGLMGIYLHGADYSNVRDNSLVDVHSEAGAPNKVGILLDVYGAAGALGGVDIHHNQVGVSGGVAADREIYVDVPACLVTENTVTRADGTIEIASGINHTVQGNDSYNLVCAAGTDGSRIAGNYTVTSVLTGDNYMIEGHTGTTLTVNGARCSITDSRLSFLYLFGTLARVANSYVVQLEAGYRTSDNTFVSTGHQISNTEVPFAAFLGADVQMSNCSVGTLYVYDGNILTGNHILSLQDYNDYNIAHAAVLASGIRMNGNRIVEIGDSDDGILFCTKAEFAGNIFDPTTTPALQLMGDDPPTAQGVGYVVANNHFEGGCGLLGGSLGVHTADDSTLTGNSISGSLNWVGASCHAQGNIVGSTFAITGDDATVTGNKSVGQMTITSNNGKVTGNGTDDVIQMYADNWKLIGNDAASHILSGSALPSPCVNVVIQGNSTGGALIHRGDKALIESNQVAGALSTLGDTSIITGNHVVGVIGVVGLGLVVRGNIGSSTFSAGTPAKTGPLTVADNVMAGGMTVLGANAVVSGNRAPNIFADDDCVVTGNIADDITVAGPNCTILGNLLTNDLHISTNGNGCAIIGNRVGNDITGNEGTAVTMGNAVVGTVFGAAVAAGAKKTEQGVLGTPLNVN